MIEPACRAPNFGGVHTVLGPADAHAAVGIFSLSAGRLYDHS